MFENSVHLMGRLTADPELKTFGDGAVVCNFTVAINRPVTKGEHPEADFVRCVAWRQTAELLFPQMPYTVVDGLIETDFGRFEGKSADELSGDPAYQAWVDAMCLTPIPDGESVADFKIRCCEAFTETIRTVPDGSRVGFVVHGGVIMAIMEAYARPKRDFYAYHIGNGECLQGVYDGETIRIKQ